MLNPNGKCLNLSLKRVWKMPFYTKNNKSFKLRLFPTGIAKTLNITSKKFVFGNMNIFSEKLTILKKKINFTQYAHN